MDEEAESREAHAFLWAGARFSELHGRPHDISAAFEESRDFGEGLFVACSSTHLCHGAVECRDAPRVFAAASGAQQCGADKTLCQVDG